MFNPGFFGKTPPKWFIGQVAFDGAIDNRENPEWPGDRVKVRIVGYHPTTGDKLSDNDLDWAIVLRTTSHGSLNRMSTGISGGEWVIGIFIDQTLEKPLPLILGVLGRSDPTYEITASQAEAQKSSEFKRTLNWYKTVQAQLYHKSGNNIPGQKKSQSPFSSPPKNFFNK